jgi:hypothetical protein
MEPEWFAYSEWFAYLRETRPDLAEAVTRDSGYSMLEAENQRLREHAEQMAERLYEISMGFDGTGGKVLGSGYPAYVQQWAYAAVSAYRRDYPKEEA